MTKMNIMKKPSISTIIVIICILIIGLYAAGEVNYYSTKIVTERNVDSPVISIPKIGVNEKINFESLNQGVLIDPPENVPLEGPIVLYGHRTLQGSPFLRLNELSAGDKLILEWPNVGEIEYTVTNSKIVPATYSGGFEGASNIYLITCDPIGSTENRLIIEGEFSNQGPVNEQIIRDNPQESNALMISGAFLLIGLIFSFLYPKDNRIYILVTVLIVSALMFYFYLNPIPSEIIYDKISFLNGGSFN